MRSKNQAVKSWLCPNEISWSAGLCPNRKPIANSSGCVQTESRLKRAGFAHTETCWKAGFVQTESRLQRAGHIQTSHTQDKEASASFFVSFCIFVLCCERFSRRIPVTLVDELDGFFNAFFWCFFCFLSFSIVKFFWHIESDDNGRRIRRIHYRPALWAGLGPVVHGLRLVWPWLRTQSSHRAANAEDAQLTRLIVFRQREAKASLFFCDFFNISCVFCLAVSVFGFLKYFFLFFIAKLFLHIRNAN